LGISVQHVDMAELTEAVAQVKAVPQETKARLQPCKSEWFDGALRIYEGLRTVVARRGLDALTLRCFDLLTSLRNTGCLALALLNAEGVPSSCEGDVPALLTMMAAQALTGRCGFQANPSRINPETGEMVFAHCTVPLDMVREYSYATHFESGIGVALHGELEEGDATLMKVSGDLKRLFVRDLTLARNQYEANLCRTQVVLRCEPETAAELLRAPIANHHVIVSGHWRKAAEALFAPFTEP
jgi:L-fucose isomerase-like protein